MHVLLQLQRCWCSLQVLNDGWRAAYALQPPAHAIEPAELARLLDGLTQTAPAILTRAAADSDPAAKEAELLELVAQLAGSCPAAHDDDIPPQAAARCGDGLLCMPS
jgi:hypothetical protein